MQTVGDSTEARQDLKQPQSILHTLTAWSLKKSLTYTDLGPAVVNRFFKNLYRVYDKP